MKINNNLINTKKANRKRNLTLTLFALPAIILLFLFNYLPMFGILIAFQDYRYDTGFFGSEWVGFENFAFFFNSNNAWIITRNTILYNAVFIVTVLVGAMIFAILLNEITNRKVVKIYQTVMFFPYFLSYAVVTFVVYAFLNMQYGVLNSFLENDIFWYNEAKYWVYILPITNFWKNVGYNTIIIYAALIAIDTSYYEAAAVDGAKRLQTIFRITLPLLSPTVIMLGLIMLGKIFYSDFGLFFMVPQNSGMLYPTTDVIDTYVYRSMTVLGDIGISAAVNAYQSTMGLILVVVANRITKKYSEDSALF